MVNLSIGFWNIASMRDKLENELVRNYMFKHDIVILSETKTKGSPSLPGFIAVNNSKSNHGGVALLIKRWLFPKLSLIDIEDEGVIWFELSCITSVRFCGMYNEPSDSSYFRHTTFASISTHLADGKSAVIVGDLNARFGHRIHDLVENSDNISYDIADPTCNQNGRSLIRICKQNNLLPVNNLKGDKSWPSKLTFRRGARWISEVDVCLVSQTIVDSVSSFSVDHNLKMPSDHAPMSVSFDFSLSKLQQDFTYLADRSSLLGLYPLATGEAFCKKPIVFNRIDQDAFQTSMQAVDPPDVDGDNIDVNSNVEFLTDTLYHVAENNKQDIPGVVYARPDRSKNRWQRILEVGDSKALWRGINW